MEKETEKQRINSILYDTDQNNVYKKIQSMSSKNVNGNGKDFNPRDSAPSLQSDYWRLKNQGNLNYGAKVAPMNTTKPNILVNAYSRNFVRDQQLNKYYGELRSQLDEDRQRKENRQKAMREMDQKDVRNKVRPDLTSTS